MIVTLKEHIELDYLCLNNFWQRFSYVTAISAVKIFHMKINIWLVQQEIDRIWHLKA